MHALQLTYDVPESDKLYKKTMMYCCECWREFKIDLTNKYVHIKVKGAGAFRFIYISLSKVLYRLYILVSLCLRMVNTDIREIFWG
ncbi:hypothetical protein K1719_016430 [Acacia pycnantha]|nr:hypothetical protein K1719_016430 [Acacia pycnantha]